MSRMAVLDRLVYLSAKEVALLATNALMPWYTQRGKEPTDGMVRKCVACGRSSEVVTSDDATVTLTHAAQCGVAEFVRAVADPTP